MDPLDGFPSQRASPVAAVAFRRLFLDLTDHVPSPLLDLFSREVLPARERVENDGLMAPVIPVADGFATLPRERRRDK
jgi:hypothetical protein